MLCDSHHHPFSCYHLLPHHSIIPTMKLFASILLSLFRPTIYSSPNGPVRPLGFFITSLAGSYVSFSTAISFFITSLAGSYVSFVFPWASQACLLSLGFFGHFLNFAFPWAFTKFFRLPQPNYIIPYPWGSWVCHQPHTFFAFITFGLPKPILAFPHHILPMVCFFSLSRLL